MRSRELNAGPWEDVTAEFDLPAGNKHGSPLPITEAEFMRLKEHAGSD